MRPFNPKPARSSLVTRPFEPSTVTPCHRPTGTAERQSSDASPASVSFTASSTARSSNRSGLVGGINVENRILTRS